MSKPVMLSARTAVVGITLLAACGAVTAAEVLTISGRDLIKTERFEPLYQDDKAGRLAYFSVGKSVIRETTRTGILNGLAKTCFTFGDLTYGTGTLHGFCRHEDADALALIQWNGLCHTAPGAGDKPQTRCWGGWVYLPGGKGRLAGVQGSGSWSGVVNAAGEFDEEFTGSATR